MPNLLHSFLTSSPISLSHSGSVSLPAMPAVSPLCFTGCNGAQVCCHRPTSSSRSCKPDQRGAWIDERMTVQSLGASQQLMHAKSRSRLALLHELVMRELKVPEQRRGPHSVGLNMFLSSKQEEGMGEAGPNSPRSIESACTAAAHRWPGPSSCSGHLQCLAVCVTPDGRSSDTGRLVANGSPHSLLPLQAVTHSAPTPRSIHSPAWAAGISSSVQ